MSAHEYLPCPSCSTPVSKKTLTKFGGVCRRCYNQPIGYRKQWIFFGLMALASPVVAIFIDQELAALEASGGTKQVHMLIALAYRAAGRLGVIVCFGLMGILFMLLCYQAFRSSRLAKARIAAMNSSTNQENE